MFFVLSVDLFLVTFSSSPELRRGNPDSFRSIFARFFRQGESTGQMVLFELHRAFTKVNEENQETTVHFDFRLSSLPSFPCVKGVCMLAQGLSKWHRRDECREKTPSAHRVSKD
jgi:hypothetical protein